MPNYRKLFIAFLIIDVHNVYIYELSSGYDRISALPNLNHSYILKKGDSFSVATKFPQYPSDIL